MLVELLSADYNEIRHNPAADVPMGTLTLIEDMIGFPLADVDISVQAIGAFVTRSPKVRMVKQAGVTIKEGEALYWVSATTDDITNVDGGATDYFVGFATEDQASASTTIVVDFDGRAEFLKA